ncbi:hypothetical protein [Mucilaginibacter celer]|uniref:DUF2892 domain-containing protein n=1 Tax=Mucilaginibacter celer TaxID=2305508 RepID=A0A494VMM9_9SPHI|nr:hypothetical protein [Mucilaginibacter celer]AYL96587.1 hypothetical protein HYN43_015330 [Mucilaginibacter celer]
MKTLLLPPDPRDVVKHTSAEIKNVSKPATVIHEGFSWSKITDKLFPEDTAENLSTTEAVIRGALVFTMPVLSAVDWNYQTHTMLLIAPVIFYLEVTAFTMYCPIKRLFSNYSHPSRIE